MCLLRHTSNMLARLLLSSGLGPPSEIEKSEQETYYSVGERRDFQYPHPIQNSDKLIRILYLVF
jgi:hypothetical protein